MSEKVFKINRDILEMERLTDTGRPNIDGVLIKKGKAVVTNTKYLIETKLEQAHESELFDYEEKTPAEIFIPSHALKAAKPTLAGRKRQHFRRFVTIRTEAAADGTKKGVISGIDASSNLRDIRFTAFNDKDFKYPKYESVLDEAKKTEKIGQIAVSPKLLKALCEYLINAGVTMIVINIPKDNTQPFYIETTERFYPKETKIVLMPMKI